MVLDGIVCPSWEFRRDLGPLVADARVFYEDGPIFIFRPGLLRDGGVEVVVPSLSTLLADSTREMRRDGRPLLPAPSLDTNSITRASSSGCQAPLTGFGSLLCAVMRVRAGVAARGHVSLFVVRGGGSGVAGSAGPSWRLRAPRRLLCQLAARSGAYVCFSSVGQRDAARSSHWIGYLSCRRGAPALVGPLVCSNQAVVKLPAFLITSENEVLGLRGKIFKPYVISSRQPASRTGSNRPR